ncbi:iron-sulfur cluster repair di-iron protein [Fulvivirga sp. M361]|uniref:iron-sulfur cluster repair di-iron protein n=1 Tax=Fulvivirga sp. M361 TaxID=2594266 RepID=UPI00117A9830|nr:iron-sulfur cluster repair di-iron protein [Fulvivirga sp. M361]TRX52211.1 iron-sulfur cluster repair di-iron protein [Fulvivirga sp. M361]
MKNISQLKVGKIVAINFRTSKVLTAHNIDFCCKGGVTLEEACKERNLSLDQIIAELEESFKTPDAFDYEHLDLKELIDIIVNNHHKYVENTVPALRTYLNKLSEVHGGNHPELLEIREMFDSSAEALVVHMRKEETIVFPYIKAMVEAKERDFPLSEPYFGHLNNPLQLMEEDHDLEGERFREIARLSGNYECPEDGCQTYSVAYALLKEFEEDLHKHIHLENNILFAKARALYSEIIPN